MNYWQPGVTLEQVERETILSALKYTRGNRTHAASALGIGLRTLADKIKKYREAGIEVPAAPEPAKKAIEEKSA